MEDPKIPLTVEQIKLNAEIADGAPDSTRDNRPRPPGWKPPLINPNNQPLIEPAEEHSEHPYNR